MGRLLNYANFAAYIFNLVVTYTVGNTNIAGKSNAEVSAEFPTLFTPAGWAFAIWGLIFVAEGAFSIYQLLPSIRDSPLVQKGVSYYWIMMVVIQAGWSFSFSLEKIPLSMAFMVGIFLSLQALVYSLSEQLKRSTTTTSPVQYALIYLPFSINWAWITAAAIVNANLLIVYHDASNLSNQITGVVISCAIFAIAAVMGGFTLQDPAYCLVLVWAGIAVAGQLKSPPAEISSRFPSFLTNGLSQAAYLLVGIAALAAVGAVLGKTLARSRPSSSEAPESPTGARAASEALLRP